MKLSDIKKQVQPLSEITNNREKMLTSELYGHVYTIDNFVITKDASEKDYAVVTVKEIPNKFHFAGLIETEILMMIKNDEEAYNEFKQAGLKVKYVERVTKENKRYTGIEIQ